MLPMRPRNAVKLAWMPQGACHDKIELRLSEERFRLLIEGVAEYAIFMLDPNGRVAMSSTAFHRKTPRPPARLAASDWASQSAAFARAEDRKRSLVAGYQAHLAKPFDVGELILVIAGLVGR
jgi:hypothetical protein